MGYDNSDKLLHEYATAENLYRHTLDPEEQSSASQYFDARRKTQSQQEQSFFRGSSQLYSRSTFQGSIISIRNSINVYDTLKE